MLDISWKAAPLRRRRRITVGIADPGTYGTWKANASVFPLCVARAYRSVRSVGVPCEGHHMDSFMTHTPAGVRLCCHEDWCRMSQTGSARRGKLDTTPRTPGDVA